MEEREVEEAEGLGESLGETAAEDSVESVTLRRKAAFPGRGTAVEAMVVLKRDLRKKEEEESGRKLEVKRE
jgi:hypothetical protein